MMKNFLEHHMMWQREIVICRTCYLPPVSCDVMLIMMTVVMMTEGMVGAFLSLLY